ncbi:pilus assembly protein PilM [Methylomonas sp. LL1]|uniref:pilus assembly protein PilM n=1 Tax=Methylomonas sp. LL1 TaxID=2785785 RepID=UPI0018C3E6B1|nr:pilus assembly protein PilM [Methylomonas sp. LL1]QPK64990.1 pilus assembly protein PilM [Methylomonas sp. LL1]
MFCDVIEAPQQQWLSKLQALAETYRLGNYSCHILLSQEQYRVFDTEVPQVDEQEMKQAVRWRIAEMLDYPADQAIIDYFPLPKSNRANSTPLLEVVSCNQAIIAPLLQTCHQAGLKVTVVEIQEMALRNLAFLLPENTRGIAVLNLQPNNGHIIIQQAGALYLSRKFNIGYNQLADSALSAELQMTTEHDNLALEIQRSLDYVENYFAIPPISSVALLLAPNRTEAIVNNLMIHHGITARAMDLSAIIDGDVILTDALQNSCAAAIGTSLRPYVEGMR